MFRIRNDIEKLRDLTVENKNLQPPISAEKSHVKFFSGSIFF